MLAVTASIPIMKNVFFMMQGLSILVQVYYGVMCNRLMKTWTEEMTKFLVDYFKYESDWLKQIMAIDQK
jgi:hypothetical protein